MSARLSEEITACVRDGRYLLSAFETEGPRVAGHFLDFTRPHLEEGDADPDPVGFLVAVERSLRAALDHLVVTDFAVAKAAGLESELRHRHQADKRQLAFLLVALRRLVLAQHVNPDMENLGLQPVNVRDAITIQRRGVLIGERFEAVNLAKLLGKSRFEGPVNLSPHVAEIRRKSADLLALSNEVDEAQRGADRARIEKNRAKDAYDRVYLRGARMFEDMCRFAGLDDLADRVRRRKGRPTVADLQATPVSADTEVPGAVFPPLDPPRGTAHGRPEQGPWQPASAHPQVLPSILRPLRGGRPRVRSQRPGTAKAGARSKPDRHPPGGEKR